MKIFFQRAAKGIYMFIKVILVLVSILFLIGTFVKNSKAESTQRYFVVTKAVNTTNGITSVTILMTDTKNDCKPMIEGAKNRVMKQSEMRLESSESSECLEYGQMSSEHLNTFLNKPIRGVIYIAFTTVIWPSRVIFYGTNESALSEKGCSYLIDQYKIIDNKARCIYGKKSWF